MKICKYFSTLQLCFSAFHLVWQLLQFIYSMLLNVPLLLLVDMLGTTVTFNSSLLPKWHLPEHKSLLQLYKLNEAKPLVRRNGYHGTIYKVEIYTMILTDVWFSKFKKEQKIEWICITITNICPIYQCVYCVKYWVKMMPSPSYSFIFIL